MPKAAIDGGEILYEVHGSGHPLLFITGLSGIARYWQAQIEAFAPRFRVVAYDQRGTGGSDRLQREFSIDQMAREVIGLLDTLGIERTHIVGHSTGGAIAQTLAAEYPQRVARLVLSSTWTHCDPYFRRLFEARKAMLAKGGQELHVMFHPLWLYPPWWVSTHDAEIGQEQQRALAAPAPVEIARARMDALLAFDRRASLARIAAPTLVLGSENDAITPSYFSRALAQAIPDARLVLDRDAGHAASKTRPEEFNRLVLDFLTEAGTAPR